MAPFSSRPGDATGECLNSSREFSQRAIRERRINLQLLSEGRETLRSHGWADGKLNDYPVAYTFGIFPLQQYLVPFPNGHLQSLAFAWDSRSQQQGGQQWFHLYPNQKMPHTDPLHWTGRNQTWNYMCAECHSTNLRKNYDLDKDSYATTWSEINISCESCHGPGSNHITWAQSREKSSDAPPDSTKGLVVQLKSSRGGWQVEESSNGTTHWQGQARTRTELETCAPCHSRRHPIKSDHQAGEPFLDGYVPSLLDEGVYFADGQILEEDYEYGSFVQSKMYHAFQRDRGDIRSAVAYAEQLVQLSPGDAQAIALRNSLNAPQPAAGKP